MVDHHLIKKHDLQRGTLEFCEHRDAIKEQHSEKKQVTYFGGASSGMGASLKSFLHYLKTPSGGNTISPEREVARVSTMLKAFCLKSSKEDLTVVDFLSRHRELSSKGGFMDVFCKHRKVSTLRRYVQSLRRYVTFLLSTEEDWELVVLATKAEKNMSNW